jgi:hypothetical protein
MLMDKPDRSGQTPVVEKSHSAEGSFRSVLGPIPLALHRQRLYRPPPLYNGIVILFLDLDFNFGILVCYFEYPEFLGIDQSLQGKHVGPVHAFEIVTFIKHFPHDFHSLLAIDGQSTRVLINLMRFRVLTASNRPDTEFIAFLAFLWESLNIVARHNPI